MKVATGTVVGGKVSIPEDFLTEGTKVVVMADDDQAPVRLSADQERELSEAMDEIRRGDFVDGQALLAELRALAAR